MTYRQHPMERDWRQWWRDTLIRSVCLFTGHWRPRKATQAWDSTRMVWFDVDPSANIVICSRCHQVRNGWSLLAR